MPKWRVQELLIVEKTEADLLEDRSRTSRMKPHVKSEAARQGFNLLLKLC